MDFESMTGTTGVAAAYNKLYVVDNKTILISDQYGDTEKVNHNFDWITNITTSELQLFGIYSKDEKYGLFSMDLTSHFFKMVPVTYTPVNLIYANQMVVVLDSDFKTYNYERNLALRETKDRDTKIVIENPIKFMTIGLAKDDLVIYYSKDKDVYSEKEKLFSVEGNVLSLIWISNYLFVIYNSLYNHYSILQYDLVNKKNVKIVEGGHISGPPVYSCIYGDEIFISASTNNRISLKLFDLPGKGANEERKRPRSVYPLFELNKINKRFITDEVNIDIEKIKTLQDYGKVDTTPAKNTLIRYYVWFFIFIFIVIVLLLAFFFKESSVIPVILLTILFIALSFLIKNKYLI